MAVTGCGTSSGELNIRSVSSGIAQGERPVPARIAEARGYFALGNVALALEAYRKAHRDDPSSVDALNGMAACYDRMGRFDLSRRYYEEALAFAPGDARLYANLAVSLEMQGRKVEAQNVRAEMEQRLAAGRAASVELAQAPGTNEPMAIESAAIPVGAPPLAAAVALPPSAPAAAVTVALAPAEPPSTGARLQRLSMGEVALVTSGKAVWKPRLAERAPISPARLTLLNAARVQGLAARTRTVLEDRGWSRIAIGDAPRLEPRSVIAYPSSRKAEAVRLSRQFGFALRHRPASEGGVVVLLGRDAAAAVRSGRI